MYNSYKQAGDVWCKDTLVEGKQAPWTLGITVQEHYNELKTQLHFLSFKGDPVPWPIIESVSRKLNSPVSNMQDHIRKRVAMLHEIEVMGGFRITEVVESGAAHGICATDVMIVAIQLEQQPSWAAATSLQWTQSATPAELMKHMAPSCLHAVYFGLKDYKLHDEEASIVVASPTQSGRNVLSALLEYVRCTGMQLKSVVTEEGKPAVTIDYYVIRVDLAPPQQSAAGKRLAAALDVVLDMLPLSTVLRKWSKQRCAELWKPSTDEKKRFFNFYGGTQTEMAKLLLEMEASVNAAWNVEAEWDSGFSNPLIGPDVAHELKTKVLDKWWHEPGLTVKAGPLVRATNGKQFTHTPLSYASASKDLTTQWKAAEKEEHGENVLRLVTHSARRAATHRARVKILASDFPVALMDELIDRHFRWKPDHGAMRKEYTGHLSLSQRIMVTLFM